MKSYASQREEARKLLMKFKLDRVYDWAFAAHADFTESMSKGKLVKSILEEIQDDELKGYIKALEKGLEEDREFDASKEGKKYLAKTKKAKKSPAKKGSAKKSPAKKGSAKKSPAKKGCKASEIRNPASGRCVSKKGAIGKKLLGKSPAKKGSAKKSPAKKGSAKKSPKKALCPGRITRGNVVLKLREKESSATRCSYTRSRK